MSALLEDVEAEVKRLRELGWTREDFASALACLLTQPKRIRIVMDGGLVQEVLNIPPGLEIEVYDYDCEGSDHPNVTTDEKGQRVFVNYWGPDSSHWGVAEEQKRHEHS